MLFLVFLVFFVLLIVIPSILALDCEMTSTKADSTASTVQAHGNCKPDFPVAILKRLDGFNQEYPIIHLESPEVSAHAGK